MCRSRAEKGSDSSGSVWPVRGLTQVPQQCFLGSPAPLPATPGPGAKCCGCRMAGWGMGSRKVNQNLGGVTLVLVDNSRNIITNNERRQLLHLGIIRLQRLRVN